MRRERREGGATCGIGGAHRAGTGEGAVACVAFDPGPLSLALAPLALALALWSLLFSLALAAQSALPWTMFKTTALLSLLAAATAIAAQAPKVKLQAFEEAL